MPINKFFPRLIAINFHFEVISSPLCTEQGFALQQPLNHIWNHLLLLLHSQLGWAGKFCRFKQKNQESEHWKALGACTHSIFQSRTLKKHPVPVSLCLSRQRKFSFQLHRAETS